MSLIYGYHAVHSALQDPHGITEIYVAAARRDKRLQEILTLAKQHNINIHPVSREKLDQLAQEGNHQGIIARTLTITKPLVTDLCELLDSLSTPPFLLILDGVQDPQNLGACLRSAAAANVHAVIVPKNNAVGITPTVRKVACGAAEIIPFIQVTNLVRTIELLKERGIWIYGLCGEATQSLYKTDLRGPLALVLGAEENGLRRLTMENCDGLLAIPLPGAIPSLNVSVATGITLFEALRQRDQGIK